MSACLDLSPLRDVRCELLRGHEGPHRASNGSTWTTIAELPRDLPVAVLAVMIKNVLLKDLQGRSGFRQMWDSLDDAVKAELEAQWFTLITTALVSRGG